MTSAARMARRSKVYDSFREAVSIVHDGATLAIGGFAMPGQPFNLVQALADHGARDLVCIANNTGGAYLPRMPDIGMLVERGLVRKVICSFTAPRRASDVLPFTRFYEAGEVDAELLPQGTIAERLRAAAAGIPAFYTPAGADTDLAEGKEIRMFDGKRHVLEHAFKVDFALVRAHRADTFGNLQYRRAQRNFNPVMAAAARCTIAEVDEDIVAPGVLDADHIHTPGIYVSRIVRVPPAPAGLWPVRRLEKST